WRRQRWVTSWSTVRSSTGRTCRVTARPLYWPRVTRGVLFAIAQPLPSAVGAGAAGRQPVGVQGDRAVLPHEGGAAEAAFGLGLVVDGQGVPHGQEGPQVLGALGNIHIFVRDALVVQQLLDFAAGGADGGSV